MNLRSKCLPKHLAKATILLTTVRINQPTNHPVSHYQQCSEYSGALEKAKPALSQCIFNSGVIEKKWECPFNHFAVNSYPNTQGRRRRGRRFVLRKGVAMKFWLEGTDSGAPTPLNHTFWFSPDFGHLVLKMLGNLKKCWTLKKNL